MYAVWKKSTILSDAYRRVTDITFVTLGEEIWNKSKQIAAVIAAFILPSFSVELWRNQKNGVTV